LKHCVSSEGQFLDPLKIYVGLVPDALLAHATVKGKIKFCVQNEIIITLMIILCSVFFLPHAVDKLHDVFVSGFNTV